MRTPLSHFALYPVRNFSPAIAGLETERGIISNGVYSPQKFFLLLPQFVRIIPLKFFTPNTDIKSKPNTTSTNSVYGAMQDGYVERFDQKISPRPSFPKRGITISPFGKGGIRGIL